MNVVVRSDFGKHNRTDRASSIRAGRRRLLIERRNRNLVRVISNNLGKDLTFVLDILLEEEKKEQDAKNKKSKAEENRKAATKSAQDSKQRQQTLRSAVFAAARSGDFAKVKKGIWEDQVDAAGGEIRDGCEKLVKKTPEDPLETLMHIAVKRDDKDLLEWLDSHSEFAIVEFLIS